MSNLSPDRVSGSIYGLAYGDAYGFQVEFSSFKEIMAKHGYGLQLPDPAIISDDTQMSLALWQALDAADIDDDASLTEAIIEKFLAWQVDEENWRAPGGTCMRSLDNIAEGQPWMLATDGASKGCGTVMRAPWIGLHPKVEREQISRVAQLQAAITHGHPTAVIAADVLAHLTYELACGELELAHAAPRAFELANTLTYQPVLGLLWRRSMITDKTRRPGKTRKPVEPRQVRSAQEFTAVGGYEVADAVAQVSWAADRLVSNHRVDPCSLTGDGWTAEEALATALLVTTAYGDKPVIALRRAASSGGDSDSIACIAGALIGAAHGDVWPQAWQEFLEPRYAAELADAAPLTV